MSALAKLNEVLFENSDSIPEGLYLELMNLTKSVFDEKPSGVRTTIIKYHTPATYKIRNMEISGSRMRIGRVVHDDRQIALIAGGGHEEEGFRLDVEDNNMFQLLTDGKDKSFFVLKKINEFTIHFEIQTFKWVYGENRYDFYTGGGIITIARRLKNSGAIVPIDLEKHGFTLIDITTGHTRANWIKCSQNEDF
jgi:hypothetical protein